MSTFPMQELEPFLLSSALKGFASGDPSIETEEPDRSTTITIIEGPWKSLDRWFGDEPYGGCIVVSYENKPVWLMTYYGWVHPIADHKPVYSFLMKALQQMPCEVPLRGPHQLVTGEWHYQNIWQGKTTRYSGEERIFHHDAPVYWGTYQGGLVGTRDV